MKRRELTDGSHLQGASKILVAGAGPAGLSCAYLASKEGHEVTVFEAERELAIKPCGELIPEETLRLTPFGKKSPWILNRINRCLLHYEGKFIREVRAPKLWDLPIAPLKGYTIDKKAFLEDLMEAARSEGAIMHFGRKVSFRDSQLQEYDLVVDATGYLRALGRPAGLHDSGKMLVTCVRMYCKGKLDSNAMVLNFLDNGYSWLIPHGDLINFGVGGFYNQNSLNNLLKENIKTFELKPAARASPMKTVPEFLGGPLEKLKVGKIVVAGEAAGAVMPTTGEGIRLALWTGGMCFKKDYEQLFWQSYGKRLKFGRRLLKLVLRISEKERLDMLTNGTPELFCSLADGVRPRIRDLAHFPWLLRHLIKF